jgi:hypothetical protein
VSRARRREHRRIVAQLQRMTSPPIEEVTPARLLTTLDVGRVVAFRTAGRPGSREPQHRTIGTLAGVRPTTDAVLLVVTQGAAEATFRVALSEPVTVRRSP